MTLAQAPSQAAPADPEGRFAWGPAAVATAISVAVFLQQPGKLVPETKLDLVIDPFRFLGQTLHLWDGRQGFGQLPDQAVGYLFPMGPFYVLGHAARIPMWIVQRSWMSALLLAALLGLLKLAKSLGIGTPATRLVAGSAYALSPAMLASVGQTSAAVLPLAMAPWALVPLVIGSQRGSPRRAAALSALAIAAMGGVNGVSVAGAVALPGLWLITRRRCQRRRSLFRWWLFAALLASLWWFVPLLLQSRYGFDFQPYTERAAQTTATGSAVEVLRGGGYWLAYVFTKGPWLRAGWELVSNTSVIVATVFLAAVGLGGIARRDSPERVYLGLALAIGTAVLVAGYGGPLSGPFAGITRTALDGPLSPFRNLSKFQPLVRVPLALGLAHGLAVSIPDWGRSAASRRWLPPSLGRRLTAARWAQLAAVIGGVAVAVGALPLMDGHLTNVGGFTTVPSYWQAAAAWLGQHDQSDATLVVPAASFAEYQWGRPLDEPLEALSSTPWAVRNLIPLGSVGATVLLDAIESHLDQGRPDPGLAPVLARSGVRHLLVRNDLDLSRVDAPAPIYVREALALSPGLHLAAQFGPAVSCGLTSDRLLIALSGPAADRTCSAIEIYDVAGPVNRYSAYPANGTTVVSGSPGSLMTLAEHNLLGAGATVLAGDPYGAQVAVGSRVVSDDIAHSDQSYGSIRDTLSYPLTASEAAPDTGRTPQQRVVVPGLSHQSVVQMTGAVRLRASSYGSYGVSQSSAQPYAAFDGDATTAWAEDGPSGPVGEWIEADLAKPLDVAEVTIETLGGSGRAKPTQVTITTVNGSTADPLSDADSPQTVPAPAGPTDFVRITIAGATATGRGISGVGFRDIEVPGLTIERSLAVPDDQPGSPAPTFVFDRARAQPDQLGVWDGEARLDRTFVTDSAETYQVTGQAVPRPGPGLDALVGAAGASASGTRPTQLDVSASSTWGSLPQFAAANLFAADPAKAWFADPADAEPVVQLAWQGLRSVASLQVVRADAPTRFPTAVRVQSPDGAEDVPIDSHGFAHFAPLVTDRLTLTFSTDQLGVSASGANVVLPVPLGFAKLRLPDLAGLAPRQPDPQAPVHLACGQGPDLTLDGKQLPTSVSGSVGDLLSLRPLALRTCAMPTLEPGSHHLVAGSSAALSVDALTLAPSDAPISVALSSRPFNTRYWSDESRSILAGPGPATYLALTDNFNLGWHATLAGKSVRAIRVDGWRQAFIIPAGPGGVVTIRFTPGETYRWAQLIGLAAVLVLLVLFVGPQLNVEAAAGPRSVPPWVVVALGAALLIWTGGALVLLLPLLLLVPARHRQMPVITALAYACAGLFVAYQTGQFPGSGAGAFGAPAQLLAVVALAALTVSLVETAGRGRADISVVMPLNG